MVLHEEKEEQLNGGWKKIQGAERAHLFVTH